MVDLLVTAFDVSEPGLLGTDKGTEVGSTDSSAPSELVTLERSDVGSCLRVRIGVDDARGVLSDTLDTLPTMLVPVWVVEAAETRLVVVIDTKDVESALGSTGLAACKELSTA